MSDDGLTPTRWWRVIASDHTLWCETSDEQEARSRMREGDTLMRMYQNVNPSYFWQEES